MSFSQILFRPSSRAYLFSFLASLLAFHAPRVLGAGNALPDAPGRTVEEGMPGMPLAREKQIFSVTSFPQGEKLRHESGYGDQETVVRMMNLMMVGGSAVEGMEMPLPDQKK